MKWTEKAVAEFVTHCLRAEAAKNGGLMKLEAVVTGRSGPQVLLTLDGREFLLPVVDLTRKGKAVVDDLTHTHYDADGDVLEAFSRPPGEVPPYYGENLTRSVQLYRCQETDEVVGVCVGGVVKGRGGVGDSPAARALRKEVAGLLAAVLDENRGELARRLARIDDLLTRALGPCKPNEPDPPRPPQPARDYRDEIVAHAHHVLRSILAEVGMAESAGMASDDICRLYKMRVDQLADFLSDEVHAAAKR